MSHTSLSIKKYLKYICLSHKKAVLLHRFPRNRCHEELLDMLRW